VKQAAQILIPLTISVGLLVLLALIFRLDTYAYVKPIIFKTTTYHSLYESLPNLFWSSEYLYKLWLINFDSSFTYQQLLCDLPKQLLSSLFILMHQYLSLNSRRIILILGCTLPCLTCSTTSTHCTSCQSSAPLLYQNSCYSSCPTGSFASSSTSCSSNHSLLLFSLNSLLK